MWMLSVKLAMNSTQHGTAQQNTTQIHWQLFIQVNNVHWMLAYKMQRFQNRVTHSTENKMFANENNIVAETKVWCEHEFDLRFSPPAFWVMMSSEDLYGKRSLLLHFFILIFELSIFWSMSSTVWHPVESTHSYTIFNTTKRTA